MYFLWFIPLWKKGHHVDATFSLFVGNWIALNWFCIEGIFLCWIILSNVMLHCYEPGHCWRGWAMKRNVSKLTYSHHSLLTPAALPILEWNNNGEERGGSEALSWKQLRPEMGWHKVKCYHIVWAFSHQTLRVIRLDHKREPFPQNYEVSNVNIILITHPIS